MASHFRFLLTINWWVSPVFMMVVGVATDPIMRTWRSVWHRGGPWVHLLVCPGIDFFFFKNKMMIDWQEVEVALPGRK